MDTTRILHVGIGNCGNSLVNDIITKCPKCESLMIDSSSDMFSLNNSKDCGKLIIPQSSINDRLIDVFMKYDNYDLFVLYFSMGEEFGSVYFENVARVIRDFIPHSKIISVGAIPNNYSTARIRSGNVTKCLNKFRELENRVIDKFIVISNYERNTSSNVLKDNTSMLTCAIEEVQKTLKEVSRITCEIEKIQKALEKNNYS